MNNDLDKLFEFALELDKEKMIGRQTYVSDASRKENDAEHAWHMAIMAILFSEYANEKVDVLHVISMALMHDVVEIDAGDTYAYDEAGKLTQAAREEAAAERIYGMLPKEWADKCYALWREFEDWETPEAKFARVLDNIQPLILQNATKGLAWQEHGIDVEQVLGRNKRTAEGSKELWDYALNNFIKPHIKTGKLTDKKGLIDLD